MADWLQTPDEEEDGASSVAQALADPRGTFGDENGAVPNATPQIQEGSPSEAEQTGDPNQADDQEAAQIAQAQPEEQPQEQDNGVPEWSSIESGLPPDESDRDEEQLAQPSAQQSAPQGEGDPGDAEAAQMAGQPITAPAPLKYQPYADHSADEQAMVTQKASEDPSKYKPSFGRKLAAALAGGLVGFGTRNFGEGINAARAVTGKPLAEAQQQWEAQEAPLKQQLAADKAADQAVDRANAQETNRYNADERNMTNQARVQSWNALADQRKAAAQAKLNTVDKNTLGPVDPNNPFGEWQGRTPNGQVVRGLEPPPAIQKDPRFIAQQRRQQLSDMDKAGVKLTRQEAKYFLINGKLAEPTAHTSINIRENPDGSAVAPGSGRGGSPTDPDNIIAKNMNAKNAFVKNWERVDAEHATSIAPEGSYVSTDGTEKVMSGPEYTARIDKFRTDLNADPNMRKAGVMVDENGNTVRVGPQTAATGVQPQRVPAPAQQQPAAPQPAQPLIKNGQGQKLTDPAIARQYLAKAGGDKNKARQLAKQDNWVY